MIETQWKLIVLVHMSAFMLISLPFGSGSEWRFSAQSRRLHLAALSAELWFAMSKNEDLIPACAGSSAPRALPVRLGPPVGRPVHRSWPPPHPQRVACPPDVHPAPRAWP